MPIPADLQAADERMKAAQRAMLDFIDGGGTEASVRNALLAELDESMANFQEVLQRLSRLWNSN
jgi:hypothetical protein